ncbi:helicase associated domain-containing protein [Kitasatospora purpeofusca]|uniref:helicase associated domain-containing protein n=1 Tax=Kitasatospora purpeofusca TaxID=67352 RepID=UPI002A5A64C8|nr:helicase associated domain-containing protein [Kitasatospora purpeofusca]MDY0812996.1 helicase associated domain-containing protein [Kitasatospora purpeofusca]
MRPQEVDPWWCPAWPAAWQRAYATARLWWLDTDGLVDWARLPEDGVRGRAARTLGEGAAGRPARPGGRPAGPARRDRLEADPELVAAKAAAEAKPTVSRGDRFQQRLAALAALVEREQHPRVPRPHKEQVESVEAGPGGEEQVVVSHFALGAWLNNQKARRAKLSPGQLAQLAEHGVEWA